MRFPKRTFLCLAIAGLVLAAAGCAKPPTAELTSAQTALDAARDADAATYDPDAWDAAEKAMNAATAEVAAQSERFGLVRSYSQARELLVSAETMARSAEAAGHAGREKAQRQAEAALMKIRGDLDAARTLVLELEACARKPKGFTQDLELMKGNLQGLDDSVSEVEIALEDEDFLEATSLAGTLLDEISEYSLELANAKARLGC